MGRLIDGDSFEAGIKILFGESNPIIHTVINKLHDQPTVEAIPKADYENRLKADLVAMLTEIQLEIEEHKMASGVTNQGTWNECIACCSEIIQQKIDKLKED